MTGQEDNGQRRESLEDKVQRFNERMQSKGNRASKNMQKAGYKMMQIGCALLVLVTLPILLLLFFLL